MVFSFLVTKSHRTILQVPCNKFLPCSAILLASIWWWRKVPCFFLCQLLFAGSSSSSTFNPDCTDQKIILMDPNLTLDTRWKSKIALHFITYTCTANGSSVTLSLLFHLPLFVFFCVFWFFSNLRRHCYWYFDIGSESATIRGFEHREFPLWSSPSALTPVCQHESRWSIRHHGQQDKHRFLYHDKTQIMHRSVLACNTSFSKITTASGFWNQNNRRKLYGTCLGHISQRKTEGDYDICGTNSRMKLYSISPRWRTKLHSWKQNITTIW